MAMGTILVTGLAGFIGAHTARRLVDRGYRVIGVDNFSQGQAARVPEGVVFHQCDIASGEISPLFEGVNFVFHLAAKNSLCDCQNDPVGTMRINVVGTANVFEAARKAGVGAVAYAQSSIVEEGPARQRGFYAISKRADEMLAAGFQDVGLTTVGLRYFSVYGPGQDYRRTVPPILSRFIITLLRGEQPILFEGDERNVRDYVYVDDLADFHLLCLEDRRVDNRMFRLGSGIGYAPAQLLECLQQILGTNITPIHRPRRANDPPVQTKADIADAAALGWRPKTPLHEGLRAMIDYIELELTAGRVPE
jgi:nucleoside-diphosphate-sugar epimerase